MKFSIRWSVKSKKYYFEIIDYLIENWSINSANKFIIEVNRNLKSISTVPKLYPKSQYRKGVRRCLINKKISLNYKLNEFQKEIELITFYDNRRNDKNLPSVLNEFN